MKCPKCNFDVSKSNKFCPECGEKMLEITTDTVSAEPKIEENVIVKKKPKNKKVKKILIISISAVVGCGLIFLILFLINPFCMFAHKNTRIQGEEGTCTQTGDEICICDDCGKTIWVGNNQVRGHFFEGNICMICGETKLKISTDTLPITAHSYDYSNNIEQTCVITDINFSDTLPLKISYTVKSTYHENGNDYSAQAKFGWKLYDADGTVIDSGTVYSDTIKVGEQSKGYFYVYDLEEFAEYKLEILHLG